MTIYTSFVPTYLYIKQHSVTGLLYFGKTIKDPIKYNGSGTYWKRHIKEHNKKYIETLWYCLFLDPEEISQFALNFSFQENISKSNLWANIMPENGLDGGDTITNHPDLILIKQNKSIDSLKRKWWTNGTIDSFSENPPDTTYYRGRLNFSNNGAALSAIINKQKHWINNGVTEYMVFKNIEILEGYTIGRLSNSTFKENKKTPKGTKWWNNGIKSIMSITPPDDSFILGRLKN